MTLFDDCAVEITEPGVGIARNIPVAEKCAAELLGRWVHVTGIGWFRWTGKVWEQQTGTDAIASQVKQILQDWILELVVTNAPPEVLNPTLKYRDVRNVDEVVKALRLIDGMRRTANELDRDPNLFNCANGIVNLRDGSLLPHDPSHLMTKISRVSYTGLPPGETHPGLQMMLDAVDPDSWSWLQQFYGRALLGFPSPDDLNLILCGQGSNGKSTWVNGVQTAFGDYAKPVPKVLISGEREHPTAYMELLGLRLALMEELGEDHRLNTARLKELSGTALIKARLMRQDYVSFPATHSLFITTNHRPRVAETDHGTWRRLRMVLFSVRFTEGGNDIRERMQDPSDPAVQALLAWLVQGCVDWLRDRSEHKPSLASTTPPSIAAVTETWRRDEDTVLRWAEECLEVGGGEATIADLVSSYNGWLTGGRDVGAKWVNDKLHNHDAFAGKVSISRKRLPSGGQASTAFGVHIRACPSPYGRF